MSDRITATAPMLGWREWVSLPALGIERLQCKVDTGAKTSSLHAMDIETFAGPDGTPWVRFRTLGADPDASPITCEAALVDERVVSDSGGHREQRCVILTPVIIGSRILPIELTLTHRDTMRFRMLLGRTAMQDRFLVDPTRSFLAGSPSSTPEPFA